MELTIAMGSVSPISRTRWRASSKLPSMATTLAPYMKAWGEFAEGDFAGGKEDDAGDAGARGVGGGGGAGIAGASADDGLGAFLDGLREGHGHAAILEGAGGVEALVLDEDFAVAADAGAELGRMDMSGVLPSLREMKGVASVTGEILAPPGHDAAVVKRTGRRSTFASA